MPSEVAPLSWWIGRTDLTTDPSPTKGGPVRRASVLIAALAFAFPASASAHTNDPPCGQHYGVAAAKKTTDLDKLRHYRDCARTPGKRRWIASKIERVKDRRDAAKAELDSLTPYGQWAIPEYIVACESGGDWGAYNPSGAAGPYQLMPVHGRPWPITSEADRIAHHRIAGNLWNGGAGASHWVCA
jgi:hypothetical protein